MSALPSNALQAAEITTINANTRVDYVLKYNQQPVIVMAEPGISYETVKSEHLACLAEQVNAAYISASIKLTNIQIRCRVIEQLYQGALFDPEKPLPLTLGRLLDAKESISLIFDQGQYLSEQILIELCQLASLANKRNIALAIVIFANHEISPLLVRAKTIFDKRLTVINADSGQIIPITSRQLKRYQASDKIVWAKLAMIVTCLLVVTGLIGYFAYFASAQMPSSKKLNKPPKMVMEQANKESTANTSQYQQAILSERSEQLAKNDEIYAALISGDQTISLEAEPNTASKKAKKLLSELKKSIKTLDKKTIITAKNNADQGEVKLLKNHKITVDNKPVAEQPLLPWKAKRGVVIQLAGFTQQAEMQAFIKANPLVEYYRFQKLVNNKPYWVLLSQVYATRAEAENAITQLPEIYQQQGPWIKSVAAIKQERVKKSGE